MKKKLVFSLILQLFALFAMAQTGSISGIVLDKNEKEPLVGTHIFLKNNQESRTAVSDFNGTFQFKNVKEGIYQLEISYIGYEVFQKEIQVFKALVSLGDIYLKEGVLLDEVEVVEQVLPVIQKGDTTQFNADAYKTMPDADAADLIEKMPTVVVDNGKVQAQGETVKQVLVDGKPFFGNDPMAALRNLPAEVIDKIQVFDDQSDQSKFTGFDDGNTSKTINIITRPNMRNGQFGKIYGGYGYDNKYQAGGNVNFFNGDQRISVIGLSNNINQQNFSIDDILGVVGAPSWQRRLEGLRPAFSGGGGRLPGGLGRGNTGATSNDFLVPQQGGITSSNAFGINFSDKWGEKLDLSASYFFNYSDNTTEQILKQQFFDAEGLAELYNETSLAESTNINHRFTGLLNYKINNRNALTWRSNMTWQDNDGLENIFGQTTLNANLLNQTESDFSADLSAINLNNSLLWQHNFEKQGRTFSIKFSSGFAPNKGESSLLSNNFFSTDSTQLNQISTLDNHKWSVGTDVQYTEPINDKSRLMLNYKANYQQEDNTTETFDFEESTQAYDLFNDNLSNIFSNDYFGQSIGGGYNFNAGKWRLMARASLQWSELLTEQHRPYTATTDNEFWNVLPMGMLMYRPVRTETFRLIYRTSTQLPSIEQLQNVVNNSNPLQLSVGKPDLVQGLQHRAFGMYSKTNVEKSSILFVLLGGAYTNNYISSSTYLSAADYDADLEKDAQITVPVNLDGYYNLRAYSTYGFPVKAIKSNLNIDYTANYSRTPGLINEELNHSNNANTGIGLTLSSNISERVDFTLSARSNYNFVRNTLQTSSNTNYLNQRTKLKFNWILGDGFIFRTDLTHDFYDGLEEDFDQNYLLWNISIGKKLFKDDRGEISLTVFDLLKQNNSLTRNVTEIYTEDIQVNVLQQYVMLNFKYDLRHFRKGG